MPAATLLPLRLAGFPSAPGPGACGAGRLAAPAFFATRESAPKRRSAHGIDASSGREADRAQRVLIIDDDPSMRESLAMVFENEGYEPTVARNGAEALASLRRTETPPDLIVLDLMMPVMNGWAFRAAQLEDDALAEIPTLVLTAAGRTDLPAHRGLAMPHVLKKPVELDMLLDMVERLLPGEGDEGEVRNGQEDLPDR